MNHLIMKSIYLIILFIGAVNSAPMNQDKKTKPEIDSVGLEKIFSSIGVISIDFEKLTELDMVDEFFIYNQDGSTYANISYLEQKLLIDKSVYDFKYSVDEENAAKKLLAKNHGFNIKEFLPAMSIIQFECKSIEKDRYEVFINKEKGITKYLKKDKVKFKYEPWAKYIFSCFISFDVIKNSLRSGSDDKISIPKQDELKQYDFKAVEISGEWMKIKMVNSICKKVKKEMAKEGWIKWREGNKLLIIMYNDCEIDKPGRFKRMN